VFRREADVTLLNSINDVLKRVARWFSYAGALLILAITALITYDVFLRYVLNDPMLGAQEVVAYMLLTSFYLFITDCWNVSTHVRMEIVYEKFHGAAKKAADAFVGVTGALLFGVMALKVWEELLYALEADQVSSELLMPIWPFKLVALLCLALFVTQLFVSAVIPPEARKH
jgi:TRAP-type C4-dicarboxylate transport system permease small subunit